MDFLSREKVVYSIQALLLFLNLSKEAQTLDESAFEKIKHQCLDLLERVSSGELEGLKGALALNTLIEQMNHSLSTPYPTLPTDTFESLVKREIVAFEHYLNQELKANHLSVPDEISLFNESLTLWEEVGSRFSATEGISELSALVEKLNRLLPKEEHYPTPE